MDEPDPIDKSPVWGGWATFAWGCLITIIFVVTQALVMGVYIGSQHGDVADQDITALVEQVSYDGTLISLATLATFIIGSVLIITIIKFKQHSEIGPYLGLTLPSFEETKKWLGIFVLLLIISEFLSYIFEKNQPHEFMVQAYTTAEPLWLLWVAMVIAAPVFEELFFRGFLLEGFRHSLLGNSGAIVLTSLLWAVIHTQYELYYIVTIFVMGVVLGMARVATGSVLLTIGLHAFVNGLATMQTAYLM